MLSLKHLNWFEVDLTLLPFKEDSDALLKSLVPACV